MKTSLSSKNFSESTYLQILDAMPDLVFVKGKQSNLLWANKAFREFYNMSAEELRGLIDAPIRQDNTQAYAEDDQYVFKTGKIRDIPEEIIIRHDGAIRKFHTVKSPIFDSETGEVSVIMGIARDITDRIAAQEKIKEGEKLLEDEKARSMFSAKLVALGEMAGGIAHEVNTPLAILMATSENLADCMQDPEINRTEVTRMAQVCVKTTERISLIVKNLRALSRDSSQDPMQEVVVAKMLENTLSFCRARFHNHGIELHVPEVPEHLKFFGREVEISQVLINLLNNAFDAVTNHGVRHVAIQISEKENFLQLSVTDSGPGVQIPQKEKIFLPFFTTKEVGKGTGLGLSISKRIADAHGGSLSLDMASAKTCFVLKLPIPRPSADLNPRN